MLAVEDGRAHLFWIGNDTLKDEFNDFELTAKVLTTISSNSGIFFHTKYHQSGWPKVALETQINSTHEDSHKTGSIYAIQDVRDDSPSIDGEWFDYSIRVMNNTITLSVDGVVVNEYVEPAELNLPENKQHMRLGKGTIAIRRHYPKSKTYFKDIKLRILD